MDRMMYGRDVQQMWELESQMYAYERARRGMLAAEEEDLHQQYGGPAMALVPSTAGHVASRAPSATRQYGGPSVMHDDVAAVHYYAPPQGGGGAMKRPLDGGNPYLSSYLAKKPRAESLPLLTAQFPQRPGEKECAYFMKTGSCSYGLSCRYDHPSWVPPGGLSKDPSGNYAFPERPGEPECAFYMKHGTCKFGQKCKYHHPHAVRQSLGLSSAHDIAVSEELADDHVFVRHPAAAEAALNWSYGDGEFDERAAAATSLLPAAAAAMSAAKIALGGEDSEIGWRGLERSNGAFGTPAPLNLKGFPLRPGELDCSFYMKSGSCRFGANCKFNHPESFYGSNGGVGLLAQPSDIVEMRIPPGPLSLRAGFPERPGEPECPFYMRTGTCKYGHTCKYHHPRVRISSAGTTTVKPLMPIKLPVKLTPAGYPRREGEVACPFYMKTGTCKYGADCKYDHPPPGEAAAKAVALAAQKESSALQAEGQPASLEPLTTTVGEGVEGEAELKRGGRADGEGKGEGGGVSEGTIAFEGTREEALPDGIASCQVVEAVEKEGLANGQA